MAQSVWMATPSNHQYKIVDVTGQHLKSHASDVEAMEHASNGPNAIVVAVALANAKGRRVSSICFFNMDILLVID